MICLRRSRIIRGRLLLHPIRNSESRGATPTPPPIHDSGLRRLVSPLDRTTAQPPSAIYLSNIKEYDTASCATVHVGAALSFGLVRGRAVDGTTNAIKKAARLLNIFVIVPAVIAVLPQKEVTYIT